MSSSSLSYSFHPFLLGIHCFKGQCHHIQTAIVWQGGAGDDNDDEADDILTTAYV